MKQPTEKNESIFLENLTSTYITSDSHQDRVIKSLAIKTFQPFIKKGKKALEFGCCDGFMTSLIADLVDNLTVVDGSKTFIELARQKAPKEVSFINSLFEDYKTEEKFDYIFATYVLEHVENSNEFLKSARRLLNEDGLLFIVVPNARAFSRQLALNMGIIDDLYNLTQNDINHGHRRVYDRITLNKEIENANLNRVSEGGLFLKPFADFQMDQLINSQILGEAQIEGLYKMGLQHPELAGSLFSVCQK